MIAVLVLAAVVVKRRCKLSF